MLGLGAFFRMVSLECAFISFLFLCVDYGVVDFNKKRAPTHYEEICRSPLWWKISTLAMPVFCITVRHMYYWYLIL